MSFPIENIFCVTLTCTILTAVNANIETLNTTNIVLPTPSTSTSGNIIKGTSPFITNPGTNNTFFGINAGNFNLSGDNNLGIGTSALTSLTCANQNIAVGNNALLSETSGNDNIAIGYNTLAHTTTSNNIAIGTSSLTSDTCGTNNIGVGVNSLSTNLDGSDNIAIGYNSLQQNDGSDNIAIGSSTLMHNTLGANNIAIGFDSMFQNTLGNNTIAIGTSAALNNNGSNNIAIGTNASITNVGGADNIAIGSNTLAANTSNMNIAIGSSALQDNSSGVNNIGVGYSALIKNTMGYDNIAIGITSLSSNTTGINNIAIGTNSLASISTNSNNIGIGQNTIFAGNSSNNTVVGALALSDIHLSGDDNTVIGYNSSAALQTGYSNVIIGSGSLPNGVGCINNICIGYQAATSYTGDESNNILIGNPGLTEESGTIHLGDTSQTTFMCLAALTSTPAALPLYIDNTNTSTKGTISISSDSIKYKENIKSIEIPTDQLYNLQPVQYNMIGASDLRYGFIAEDIDQILPNITLRINDQIESFNERYIPPILMHLIKDLNERLATIEKNQKQPKKTHKIIQL